MSQLAFDESIDAWEEVETPNWMDRARTWRARCLLAERRLAEAKKKAADWEQICRHLKAERPDQSRTR